MGMRVLSLFSGIGAFETALDEENIDWELDHYCEIDKYACMSYNQIHRTTDEDNLKDVTHIDYSKIGDIDLVTYGFPCQDISVAGHQKGFSDEEGNLTRSGLFFNAADIIRHTKPKFAIFENVKNLTGKKFKAEFETVLSVLDELGYNTYWKVLNAKDYGIPQNRERVFGISIRKDIDHGYEFPKPIHLYLRLKDMLEEEVDEKYYLSEKVRERFKLTDQTLTKSVIGTTAPDFRTIGQRDLVYQKEGIMGFLVATDYKQPKQILESTIKQVGNIDLGNNESNNRVYSPDGLSPTLNTMQGGHRQPKIIEPVICASRGRNPNNPSSRNAGGNSYLYSTNDFRIRKLTPRECWRLMGFKDKYFDGVQGVSNTQLYKQAGNSIVVDVLRAIFRELKKQYPFEFEEDDL